MNFELFEPRNHTKIVAAKHPHLITLPTKQRKEKMKLSLISNECNIEAIIDTVWLCGVSKVR